MKKKITTLLLMLLALNLSAQTTFLNGSGTEDSPYLIGSIEDLEFMRDKVNNDNTNYGDKHYLLTDNLTFADDAENWDPIGQNNAKSFKGTFDGGDYAISNLKMGSETTPLELIYAGLFGYTDGATISNLTVVWTEFYNSVSENYSYCGAIAGFSRGGNIINCSSSGKLNTISFFSGGIVGQTIAMNITNCSSSIDISSSLSTYSEAIKSYCGGIVGFSDKDVITNCIFSGNLFIKTSNSTSYCGGIAGNTFRGSIIDCISTGSLSSFSSSTEGFYSSYSGSFSGGIVGNTYNTNVSNCITSGVISASSSSSSALAGGIVARCEGGDLKNCNTSAVVSSYTEYFSCNSYSGGIAGVIYRSDVANCSSSGTISSTAIRSSSSFCGGIGGQSFGGSIKNCIVPNGGVTALGDYTYACRIVGHINNTTLAQIYAKENLEIKKGPSQNELVLITNFIDVKHGKSLLLDKPEDLLNAWVFENSTEENPYFTWIVKDDKLTFGELPLGTATSLTGDGSATDPYQISTAAELKFMRNGVNFNIRNYTTAHYKMMADIKFDDTDVDWVPIGGTSENTFKGVFDGNNFVIDGIKMGSKDASAYVMSAGLFSIIDKATISNLSVVWKHLYATYSSTSYVGGIAGHVTNSIIGNCSLSGDIFSFGNTSYAGGIAAKANKSSIINCGSNGNVYSKAISHQSIAGGIVAETSISNIINCYSSGSIYSNAASSARSSSSGIVAMGSSSNGDIISNCIALNDNIISISEYGYATIGRIVARNEDNVSFIDNYAKTGIVMKVGLSESDLSNVVINDANKGLDTQYGADLGSLQPVNLLNAWVYKANETAETPYLTWAVKEGVNNGYPIFGDPTDPTQCGDDAFWSYDEATKTITITGTGAMWDFDVQSQPWNSIGYKVTGVLIEEGITYIGANSFNGMKALVSVTTGVVPNIFEELSLASMGGSLTKIGHSAFFSCVSLKEVEIPEGVHTVGPMAFFGCSSLEEITIPSTLQYWRAWIFKNCTGLKKVTFSEGVTATGTYSFVGCTSLEEVVLPSTMERLEGFAFQGCKALKEITIPSEVTHIGLQAFENCSGLTKITTLAATPANVLEAAFNGVNKDIPVIVPVGTVDDHKAADGWKEFTNIQDGSTGIAGTQGNNGFVVDGNNIVLSEAQQVAVYSLSGALVYQGYTDSITIDEAGMYIVKIASGAVKIVIR